jgi:hypothetical protein
MKCRRIRLYLATSAAPDRTETTIAETTVAAATAKFEYTYTWLEAQPFNKYEKQAFLTK